MSTINLQVTGMTCPHCEAAVRNALSAVPGVSQVLEVNREKNLAVIEGDAELAALVAAIKEEGYEAVPA